MYRHYFHTLLIAGVIMVFGVAGVPVTLAAESSAVVDPDKHAKLRAFAATVRQPIGQQQVVAGYLTLENSGPGADELVNVTSEFFSHVEIHQHSHDNGMMRMRKLDSVVILEGETVVFQPGGLHLMLFDPVDLNGQTQVELQLHFLSGFTLTITATMVGLASL